MLTDTLCTRCGLCCDGTLLGDVELTGPAEAAPILRIHHQIDRELRGFSLAAIIHFDRCARKLSRDC